MTATMDAGAFLRALVVPELRRDEILWITQFETNPLEAGPMHWAGERLNGVLPQGNVNGYISLGAFRRGGRRKKEDQTRAFAVALDDVATDDLVTLPLDPTWILESSPYNNQVGYTLVDGDNLKGVDRVLRMLAAKGFRLGPDKSGNCANRYVRLPGCLNTKRSIIEEHGQPWVTRLEALNPERRYTLAQLAAAFASVTDAAEGRAEDKKTDAAFIDSILSARSFHDSFVRLAARWIGRGQSPPEVESGLTELADRAAETAPPDRLERLREERQQIPRYVREAVQKYRLHKTSHDSKPLEWPDTPGSLEGANGLAQAFPVKVLPPIIREAIEEYQAYGRQPLAMVASSALGLMALATQGLANVARDEQLVSPLSLNLMCVAESGERKTAADTAMTKGLIEWQAQKREELAPQIAEAEADLEAWEAEREGLKAQIRRAKTGEVQTAKKRLVEHLKDKPTVPVSPRLRYEDANPESLADALAQGWPSAAMWSDEGALVIGSHGMGKESIARFLALLNRLWDGRDFEQVRKQARSVEMRGRRFSCCILLQPDVLREILGGTRALSRGSGFLARYLICVPETTMGTRLYSSPPEGMPKLSAFDHRVQALLNQPLPQDKHGGLDLPCLRLTKEARTTWRIYHDEVERELRTLGAYSEVRDFAAKSAENAARIAGGFHVFREAEGDISAETMTAALEGARWYLNEALRAMAIIDEPPARRDARVLLTWLQERDRAGMTTPQADILRYGPNSLRTKVRRDAALEVLADLGITQIDSEKRVVLHPKLGEK